MLKSGLRQVSDHRHGVVAPSGLRPVSVSFFSFYHLFPVLNLFCLSSTLTFVSSRVNKNWSPPRGEGGEEGL